MEATFKAPDGYGARMLVLSFDAKMYVLFVHAKTGVDRLYNALDKSFTVTG